MVVPGKADSSLSNLTTRLRESAKSIMTYQKSGIDDIDRSPIKPTRHSKITHQAPVRKRTMGEITGIEKSLFPIDDKLSVSQMERLYHEMLRLLNIYGFQPDYPDELPIRRKYQLLLSKWGEKYQYPQKRKIYMTFCDCEPSNCPFDVNVCQCKTFNGFSDFYDDSTVIF